MRFRLSVPSVHCMSTVISRMVSDHYRSAPDTGDPESAKCLILKFSLKIIYHPPRRLYGTNACKVRIMWNLFCAHIRQCYDAYGMLAELKFAPTLNRKVASENVV